MHAKHHLKTGQLQQLNPDWSDRSTPLVRPVTSTSQTGAHQSPEMARNHLKTFYMHPTSHFKLKLLPLLAMHESSQKCKTFNLELLK
jgi:hypothetical protein